MELKKKSKAMRWLVGAVLSWITGWAVIKCSVGVLALFVGGVIWRMFVRDFVEEW